MHRNLRRYKETNIYQKEQKEYIQDQTNKIRNSVEERQSRIAWQAENIVSKRKRTSIRKPKAASQKGTNSVVEKIFQKTAWKLSLKSPIDLYHRN